MIRSGIFLCALLCSFSPVKAQEKKIPNLSQIHIGIGYMHVLHFSPEVFDYIPTGQARLTIGTNYEHGYIKANLQYTDMVSSTRQPGCSMYDMSLSYVYAIRLYKKLFLYSGAQIGLNTVHFYGTDVYEDRSLETEVSGGLEVGLEMKVIPKLGLSGSYKLQRIFATPRNDLSMLDFGVVYYFNSSDKLKQWLE